MLRRSLTIIEMLIALTLVLALGALIYPSLMESLDEQSFESAADGTNEQLMLARAHAQAVGTPVEVTYSADKSQVQARLFMPFLYVAGSKGGILGPTAGADEFEQSGEGSRNPEDCDAPTSIEQSWARLDLGRGVRLATRPPTSADSANANGASRDLPPDDVETLEDLGKGQEIRLAVFMPDGSALTGDPVWLNDDKGRCGMITINPWNGMPFFQRLEGVAGADQTSSNKKKSDAERSKSGVNGEPAPMSPAPRSK